MSNALMRLPEVNLNVRAATLDDVPFIDALQKQHSKQLGFMRTSWIEAKIGAGQVLVAPSLGYVISTDRYFKRDDCGIIYQMCVVPGARRGLVAANLLKAVFDRAAYGCRLFCCWCAQDLEANRFWEAMGFVPLAYRAGSEKKGRVHIFWQKRIRSGDDETPWWFPAKTDAGSLRADRIVLPIPMDKHWSEEMPVLLPPDVARASRPRLSSKANAGETPAPRGGRAEKPKSMGRPVKQGPQTMVGRGLHFAPVTKPATVAATSPIAIPIPVASSPKPREKKPKRKNDPKLVSAARELRDRWLEQVNAGQYVFEDAGKYDVSRALHDRISHGSQLPRPQVPLLPAPEPRAA